MNVVQGFQSQLLTEVFLLRYLTSSGSSLVLLGFLFNEGFER